MSADDGVYILETQGPEYRIAHMQAVDNLFEEYNPATENWKPNKDVIVDAFKDSKVFTNLEEAWDAAGDIEVSLNGTEYGMNLVTEFKTFKFSDFIGG